MSQANEQTEIKIFTLQTFPNKAQLNVLRQEKQIHSILQIIYNKIINDISSNNQIKMSSTELSIYNKEIYEKLFMEISSKDLKIMKVIDGTIFNYEITY
jgi:hypothetical protein